MRSWSGGQPSTYHQDIVPNTTSSSGPCILPVGSLSLGFLQILAPLEGFLPPLKMATGTPKDWLGKAASFPPPSASAFRLWSEQPPLHQDGKGLATGYSTLARHWAVWCTSRRFLFPIKSQFLYNLPQATCTVQIFII